MAVKLKKNRVNPLNWKVPIVNKDGTPTPEFIQKWTQQAAANATVPDLTTAATVSAMLDSLGLVQGDILYRDATLWKVLAPGTLGYILKAGGAAANPAWESVSTALDGLGSTQGNILYRNGSVWTVLAPGTDGQLLQYDATAHAPKWSSIGGVLLGIGAPASLQPAGTLYSQTDTAAVWSSQPTNSSSPAVVQFGSNSGNGAAIGAVTLPGNPTVGNILIAFLGTGTNHAANLAAGWTSFDNGSGGGTTRYGRALYRYVQVGDVALLPAIGSGGSFFWFAEVYEISGVTGVFATDIVAHAGVYGQTTSPFNTTAGSTTANNQLVLLGGGTYDASSNMTNPAGWTSDILANNFGNYGAWLASSKAFATAGTSYQASIVFPTGALLVAFAIQVLIANTGALVAHWTYVGPAPVHTQQVLNSGSGATYTTPPGCRQIIATFKAGGGGGSAASQTGAVAGSDGSDTIFNSVHAAGGKGGTTSQVGGAGGTAGSGSATLRISGFPGCNPIDLVAAANAASIALAAGNGGGPGAGIGTYSATGTNAATNSGSGGGGGGGSIVSTTAGSFASTSRAGGGGEGETAILIINNPSATYTYTVGAGGNGAALQLAFAGGNGAAGKITVDEYY